MMQKQDDILIRLANSSDSDNIVGLQIKSLKKLSSEYYDTQQLEALIESKSYTRGSDETIFIAESKSKMLGFAAISKHDNIICAVFVDPDFIRQGIGSRLLKTIEQEASRRRIKTIQVISSLSGQAFYKANGYITLSQTYLLLNSINIPCIQLEKSLISSPIKSKNNNILDNSMFSFTHSII